MQHAKLSPSSSSRWLTCTASVEACASYENTTNSAANWGTSVHGIGELLLSNKKVKIGDVVEGLTVDSEMMKCAEDYVEYCLGLTTEASILLVEEKFDLSFIAPDTFGTGDFSCLNNTHLHIVDLKTGHNLVKAEENTQLMLYALGAIYDLEDLGYTIEKVTLHIMQSRAGHVDEWETDYDSLMKFKEFCKIQAEAIRTGDTTFNPNIKACKWCPHQVNCEALSSHVMKTVAGEFDDITEVDASKATDTHIKTVLDNVDLIQGFIKAVQEAALSKLQAGEEIEGYKLVESKTNRKWRDETEVEAYLKKKKIKVADMYDTKLKSMTAILKLRPKDEELQAMLIKPEGKPTLAPISDKRPPLQAVCNHFEDLDEEL